MSFADLMSGGAECGPSNPLSNFTKRFGQDRSAQLDRFGEGSEAGSSSSNIRQLPSFRTQQGKASSNSEQAFFQHQPSNLAAFDLNPLNGALPFSPPVGPLDYSSSQHKQNFDQSWHHVPAQDLEYHRQIAPSPRSIDAGWAREFSPGRASNAVQSSLTSSSQHEPMQQIHNHAQRPFANRSDVGTAPGMARLNMMGMRMGPNMHTYNTIQTLPQQSSSQERSLQTDTSQWDTAFTAYERPDSITQAKVAEEVIASLSQVQPTQSRANTSSSEADDLAKTAGRLVSTVEHDGSTKFKQSNFLNLMRKIRDKQAGIQGTNIVETNAEQQASSSTSTTGTHPDNAAISDRVKGKKSDSSNDFRNTIGREPSSQQEAVEWARQRGMLNPSLSSASHLRMAPGPESLAAEVEGRDMLNEMWAEEDARSEAIERQAMERAFLGDGGDVDQRRREDAAEFAKYQRVMGSDFGSAAESQNRASMEEEFDLQGSAEDFVGRRWEGVQGRGVAGVQGAEWDTLQRDWDTWQATSTGMTSVLGPPASAASAPQYEFQSTNPYIGTITPRMDATTIPADMQSVLEREAAVQRDPTSASAWYDLGVKQQENEREGSAIAALHRAIQLEPTLRDAWLALAVSYTNENERMSAFEAIERWIEATPDYRAVVKQHQSEEREINKSLLGFAERHERLSNLLIVLARHGSTQDQIDADVQVALGVLFNASEDYDKAVDCFTAALSVRPEDWLLYNRLGATLSNSGRSEESLRYYHQALDLRPGFVRCHFNLSISCLNLKMYQDCASHIFTALTLQSESTADVGGELKNEGGVTSSSLWETLRISCELMQRPDLALLTHEKDLNKFDPSDFWHEGPLDQDDHV
ncbi:hypothetical protein CBS101457_001875 [Exobasidium rhododendri]|nr:hypothetical protein CBS101457_001875 [Exobasidium rhododendri]